MLPLYLMIFGAFGVALLFTLPTILDDERRGRAARIAEEETWRQAREADEFVREMVLGARK